MEREIKMKININKYITNIFLPLIILMPLNISAKIAAGMNSDPIAAIEINDQSDIIYLKRFCFDVTMKFGEEKNLLSRMHTSRVCSEYLDSSRFRDQTSGNIVSISDFRFFSDDNTVNMYPMKLNDVLKYYVVDTVNNLNDHDYLEKEKLRNADIEIYSLISSNYVGHGTVTFGADLDVTVNKMIALDQNIKDLNIVSFFIPTLGNKKMKATFDQQNCYWIDGKVKNSIFEFNAYAQSDTHKMHRVKILVACSIEQ